MAIPILPIPLSFPKIHVNTLSYFDFSTKAIECQTNITIDSILLQKCVILAHFSMYYYTKKIHKDFLMNFFIIRSYRPAI